MGGLDALSPSTKEFSLLAKVMLASGGPDWWLTVVYGPS
jgi:hypothetical protein